MEEKQKWTGSVLAAAVTVANTLSAGITCNAAELVTLAPENILNVQVVDEEGNLVEGTSLSLTNASGEVVAKWEDGGSVEAYNNSEIEKAGEFMEPFTSLEYLVTPYEIQSIRNIAEYTSYGGSTFLVESGTSDYEITYKEAMETALTVPAKTLVIIVDDSWGQRSETGRIEFYNTEDYVFPLDSSTVGKNEYSLADLDAGEYRLWYFFCNIGRTPASPTFSCTDEPVEYVKMQVKLSEVSEYFTEDGLFTENGRTYSLSQEGSDQNAAVVFFSGSVVQAVVPNSEGIVELYVDKNTRKISYIINYRYKDEKYGKYLGSVDDDSYFTEKKTITVTAPEYPEEGTTLMYVPAGTYTIDTITAPSGYDKTTDVEVVVDESQQVQSVKVVLKKAAVEPTPTAAPSSEHVHKYGDYKYNAETHWGECSCGERSAMVAHTFEWVVDKEATELENGAKHEECIWCHYAKDVVEIPMLGGTSIASPKTGDTGSWICVAACMVFAAGVGMVVYKRKEN